MIETQLLTLITELETFLGHVLEPHGATPVRKKTIHAVVGLTQIYAFCLPGFRQAVLGKEAPHNPTTRERKTE